LAPELLAGYASYLRKLLKNKRPICNLKIEYFQLNHIYILDIIYVRGSK